MSIPLALRKDIRDNEEKTNEALKQLSAALGFDVSLDVSWEDIVQKCPNEKFPGRTVMLHLTSLAKIIGFQCKGDEIIKAEFARVVSKKKVAAVVEDITPEKRAVMGGIAAAGVRFVDGVMQMVIATSSFGGQCNILEKCNVAEVMSKTTVPPGGIPMLVRHALNETEPARVASLKKISAAVGHTIGLDFNATEAYHALKAADCPPHHRSACSGREDA